MSRLYEPHGFDYELTIISPVGQGPLQINELVQEINWYEDVFSPFMKIEIAWVDALGLFDKLPITGDETIVFTYSTPNETEYTQLFNVYKVAQRQLAKERTHSYIIHGISLEGMNNSLTQVYDSYVKQSTLGAISDVFNKYLAQNKSLVIDGKSASDTILTKIGTGQQPARFISELCNETQSSQHPECSSYLFWENRDQFNIRTVSSLLDQEYKYKFYLGDPTDAELYVGEAKGQPDVPAKTVIHFRFNNNMDQLDEMMDGMSKNEINIIDPILKRFKMNPIEEKEKYQFDYEKDFDKLEHIKTGGGSKWIVSDGKVARGEKPGASHRRMFFTQIEEDGENYPTVSYLNQRSDPDNILSAPRKRQKFAARSIHERRNLMSHTIDITTPGTTDIMAGDHVLVHVPQPTQLKSEFSDYLLMWGDEPNFVITGIRHVYRVAEENYFSVYSCSKESYIEQPVGKSFNNDPFG